MEDTDRGRWRPFIIFLALANAAELPNGLCRYTQFSLAVLDQIDDSFTVRRDTQLQFDASMLEWGFSSFMPLIQLYDAERGYIVDDKVIFEAYVTLPRSKYFDYLFITYVEYFWSCLIRGWDRVN